MGSRMIISATVFYFLAVVRVYNNPTLLVGSFHFQEKIALVKTICPLYEQVLHHTSGPEQEQKLLAQMAQETRRVPQYYE